MNKIEQNRLNILLRHIANVRDSCHLLGSRLLEQDVDIGLQLIANGNIHDYSKFSGIEWLYLHGDVKEEDLSSFRYAARQHVTTNMHHPEYWGHINSMPSLFIAEMVCDWKSRSSEFGNNLTDWIKDRATSKFHFTSRSAIYKEIMKFVSLLLEPEFK